MSCSIKQTDPAFAQRYLHRCCFAESLLSDARAEKPVDAASATGEFSTAVGSMVSNRPAVPVERSCTVDIRHSIGANDAHVICGTWQQRLTIGDECWTENRAQKV